MRHIRKVTFCVLLLLHCASTATASWSIACPFCGNSAPAPAPAPAPTGSSGCGTMTYAYCSAQQNPCDGCCSLFSCLVACNGSGCSSNSGEYSEGGGGSSGSSGGGGGSSSHSSSGGGGSSSHSSSGGVSVPKPKPKVIIVAKASDEQKPKVIIVAKASEEHKTKPKSKETLSPAYSPLHQGTQQAGARPTTGGGFLLGIAAVFALVGLHGWGRNRTFSADDVDETQTAAPARRNQNQGWGRRFVSSISPKKLTENEKPNDGASEVPYSKA